MVVSHSLDATKKKHKNGQNRKPGDDDDYTQVIKLNVIRVCMGFCYVKDLCFVKALFLQTLKIHDWISHYHDDERNNRIE